MTEEELDCAILPELASTVMMTTATAMNKTKTTKIHQISPFILKPL